MAKSFKQAFAAARKAKGAGGTFSWNGKKFNTDYAEEKAGKAAPKKETKAAKKPSYVNSKGLPKAGGSTPNSWIKLPSMPKPKVVGGLSPHSTTMVVHKDSWANKEGPAVRKAVSELMRWGPSGRGIRTTARNPIAKPIAAASSTKAAKGGSIKKLAKGGRVGDGCAKSGRTKGRFV